MASMTGKMARRGAAAAVAVALSMALAGPAGAAQSREDYPGGESAFKEECRMAGGRFERATDGKVRCYFGSGWVIVCDKGAKDCRSFDQNSLRAGPSRTYSAPSTVGLVAR